MSANGPHAPGEFGEPPAPARGSGTELGWLASRALKALASLQLTVGLMACGVLLVFFGTLAQIDNGIWSVVEEYFASWVVLVPAELIHKFLGVFWKEMFPPGSGPWGAEYKFPLPGGFTIGFAMLANLLAAHAVRFRLSWKRAGVILIHSGLALLLVGEYMTRTGAVEQQMVIPQGSDANYTEDTRNLELAFTDRSDPAADHVVSVSQNRLMQAARSGQRVAHPDLPVDVQVLEYMKNSDLKNPGPDNRATAGAGTEVAAVRIPEASGVDTKQQGDVGSAYVRFFDKPSGADLGTYLVSQYLKPEPVRFDGKPYQVALRRARYYKPYRIHLNQFRFDRYEGTQKPKNYSSDVLVYDEAGNLQRDQRISMNNPLRYGGETFYQSSFDKAETTTILQVVKNPGSIDFGLFHATVDYIACTMVGVGLLLHFVLALGRFLMRLSPRQGAAVTGLARWVPWAAVGVAAVGLAGAVGRMTPRDQREPYDVSAFARIPVLEGGRIKPIESVARVYMRTLSHGEDFVDENGKRQPAVRWYLDLIGTGTLDESSPAWRHPVFRIANDQVRADLKLPPREGLRYSLAEIEPRLAELDAKAIAARKLRDAKKPVDLAGEKMIELQEHIQMARSLAQLKGMNAHGEDTLRLLPPEGDAGWRSLGGLRDAAEQAGLVDAQQALKRLDPNPLFQMSAEQQRRVIRAVAQLDLDQFDKDRQERLMSKVVEVLLAPPADIPPMMRPGCFEALLLLLPPAEVARIRAGVEARVAASPAARGWERMVAAYREQKPEAFNAAVAEYRETDLAGVPDRDKARVRVETDFDRFEPFVQCIVLYVFALVLGLIGFVLSAADRPNWAAALRRSAFRVLVVALLVHAAALVGRMYLMDRPLVFVTNLYSSAVFIGMGCVALGVLLELIFPLGIATAVAAVLGLTTTIVAHNLGTQDTMEMLEAVLDTNFWLATHVTTVTLGYTATFFAGFLGAVYVVMMLGAVVRDSYARAGEPTLGELLAFGAAAVGVVTVPVVFVGFVATALNKKYERLPPVVVEGGFWLLAAAAVMYAVAVMLTRVAAADARPAAGRVPRLAEPVAALALTPESGKMLGQMIYGVLCFATMLSFIGTVLGGIWADQSWGRFWGWDPKENGAVLIVLWNALILHARWCGLVKDRGVAVLAVFGNVVTAWSWYGTNQLGIGLHAYGFDSRLADGCFNFWLSQLFILGVGAAIPRQFWAGATRRVPVANVAASVAAAEAGAAPATSGPAPVAARAVTEPPPLPNGPGRRDRWKKNRKR
jgi:ABC-type transport system involved in cytochrome c biogenesis permease subunit